MQGDEVLPLDQDRSDRIAAAIVDTTVLGFGVTDVDFRFRWVNPALCELFGTTEERLLGRSALDLIHPDDRPRAIEGARQLRSDDPVFGDVGLPIQYRLVREDGTSVAAEVGAVILDDHPVVQGIVVRVRPLRGQHHVDEALRLLAGGGAVREVLRLLGQAIGDMVEDGCTLIAVRESGRTWSLPAEVPPGLGVPADVDPRHPWTAAVQSGETRSALVDELPPEVAAAARAHGYAACWAVPVPTQDGLLDACVLVWRTRPRRPLYSSLVELRRAADVVGLVIDQQRTTLALRYAATHDQLTGLLNRATFYERLAEAAAGDRPVGVFYLDLDGFKAINDRYGHPVGDTVLQEAAARIALACREGDTVARLGGDELAVICHDLDDPAALEAIATRILAAMAPPIAVEGERLAVGVSIGIASTADLRAVPPLDGSTAESEDADGGGTLLGLADRALYRAKAGGRGRWARVAGP